MSNKLEKYYTFDKFTLTLAGTSNHRYISDRKRGGKSFLNFDGTLASRKPKLYIVQHEASIVYIGFTVDLFSSRLRNGLAPGKYDKNEKPMGGNIHGYHGYKWKMFNQVDIMVWTFKNFDIPISESAKLMFENIEAEMVHFFKNQTGNWPKYQSEIHFYSKINKQNPLRSKDMFGVSETETAQEILKSID
jgi:hypothetical protein